MTYTFSDTLFNLLVEFEGLKLNPYLDTAGVPTIGVGTIVYPNGKKVTMQDKPITREQAKQYALDHATKITLPALNKGLKVPQTQNQIDAIGSLVYNIGNQAFLDSTVLKRINAKDSIENIKEAWYRWNKSGGKITKGLVIRREKEFNFYIKK